MTKKIPLNNSAFPAKLQDIPTPPKQLFALGDVDELNKRPIVSIVGSRAVTPYGRAVTAKISYELAIKGVGIVSGLALGIDALAHKAALEAGGYTAAVLPSCVEKVYPATNRQLAQKILDSGGALISEYEGDMESFKANFIARNRLVSGLCDVLLIIEAGEKSGTLHTANFALDQGKTVMAIPGNITSPTSKGTNALIKTGAIPVTSTQDVLDQLGISETATQQEIHAANKEEAAILNLLKAGITDAAELLSKSDLNSSIFNQTLTMLEINGKIKPLGAGHWSLK